VCQAARHCCVCVCVLETVRADSAVHKMSVYFVLMNMFHIVLQIILVNTHCGGTVNAILDFCEMQI